MQANRANAREGIPTNAAGVQALNAVLDLVDAEVAGLPQGFTRGYLREVAADVRRDFGAEPQRPIALVARLRECP